MSESNNIKQTASKIKNGEFISEMKANTSTYRNGAILGGVMGLACSLFVLKGKKWFLSTALGVVGGGYLASRLSERTNESKSIKKVN